MTTVNQNTTNTTVEIGDDDTTVTQTTTSTEIDADGQISSASQLASTATGDVSSTNVQAAIAELASEKVAKAGDTMTGTLTTDTWGGAAWHNGSVPTLGLTDAPVLIIPDVTSGARRVGLMVCNNHLVVMESSDSGATWDPVGFWDHATGIGANSLIRFFDDVGFDTGFIGAAGGLIEDRIGVGLGTDFTDGNYDNPSLSKIRWWFGTSGDYDFVPGKHNAYDLGEAVRAVRTIHAMTGTFQTGVTVGGASVLTTAHTDDTSDAHDASAISYAGSTNLAADDVEEALDELDTEKLGLAAGGTVTGSLEVTPWTPGRAKLAGSSPLCVPGVSMSTVSTVTIAANRRHFMPVYVLARSVVIDQLVFEVTGAVALSTARVGVATASEDWQPTAITADSGELATTSNGVITHTLSPALTLAPGPHLFILQATHAITLRALRGSPLNSPIEPALGTAPFSNFLYKSSVSGALDTTNYDTTAGSGTGFNYFVACRVSDPTA